MADGSGWAIEVQSEFGIDVSRFPDVRRAGYHLGGLLTPVAREVGLPAGLAVHVGGGDTHLSALSTLDGIDAKGAAGLGADVAFGATVVAGSTAPVQVAVRSAGKPEPRWPLLMSPHVVAGVWAYESNVGPAGSIVAKLSELAELSGGELAGELVRRGFETVSGGSQESDRLGLQPVLRSRRMVFWPSPLSARTAPRPSRLGRHRRGYA